MCPFEGIPLRTRDDQRQNHPFFWGQSSSKDIFEPEGVPWDAHGLVGEWGIPQFYGEALPPFTWQFMNTHVKVSRSVLIL